MEANLDGSTYHVRVLEARRFPLILWNRKRNKTFWDSKLSEICQLGIQLIFFSRYHVPSFHILKKNFNICITSKISLSLTVMSTKKQSLEVLSMVGSQVKKI